MVALATERELADATFGARLWGAVTLRAAAYREFAAAPSASRQALALVLAVAALRALVRVIERASDTTLLPQGYGIPAGYALELPLGTSPNVLFAGRLGVALLFGLLAWSARARMLRLAARLVLGVRLDRAPLLRVVGYVQPFGLAGLLPVVGPVLGLLLTTVAIAVGVRELAGITIAKALLVALLALVFTVLFIALIAGAITAIVVLVLP